LLCAACSSLSFEGSFKKAEGEIGLGNYAKAAKLYEKLANKFAGDDRVAVIWLRLGDLYAYPMDRAVDGLGAYQKAIESSPTSEAARLAHERRAEVFEKIGRPSGMIEEYTALLKYFPDSADAPRYKMRLGESYLMAEEYQQARTELRGFVEKAGVEASQRQRALFDIGETYFLEGKPGKAVRFYYTLLRENPKSPLAAEAELRIATCLEEMGYLGTAYKFVYDAKNRYPNEKVIDERLEGLKNRGKGYEKSKSVKNPASGKTAEGVEEKPPIE
jgi:tetratricopeptide (TPR) repeat protein